MRALQQRPPAVAMASPRPTCGGSISSSAVTFALLLFRSTTTAKKPTREKESEQRGPSSPRCLYTGTKRAWPFATKMWIYHMTMILTALFLLLSSAMSPSRRASPPERSRTTASSKSRRFFGSQFKGSWSHEKRCFFFARAALEKTKNPT